MRRLFYAVILVIALTDCTPPAFLQEGNNAKQAEPTIISSKKIEKKDYDTTLSDCEFEASQNGDYDSGLIARIKLKKFISDCMAAKGWTLREQ
jgi:hypothetical protein